MLRCNKLNLNTKNISIATRISPQQRIAQTRKVVLKCLQYYEDKIIKLREKPPKDPEVLERNETKLKVARVRYDTVHAQLTETLQTLNDEITLSLQGPLLELMSITHSHYTESARALQTWGSVCRNPAEYGAVQDSPTFVDVARKNLAASAEAERALSTASVAGSQFIHKSIANDSRKSASLTDRFPFNAVAMFKFVAEDDDELDLARGEIVTIVEPSEMEGWWIGRAENGKRGLIPFNYLQSIEE
eukprot:c4909_g1_i1.p1 GENE.c4909_g1_i1~~c4909_g1_i1.p1  ORF type:complete len:246 (+),score=45.18 c4909_g1_i1:405-1142(+)